MSRRKNHFDSVNKKARLSGVLYEPRRTSRQTLNEDLLAVERREKIAFIRSRLLRLKKKLPQIFGKAESRRPRRRMLMPDRRFSRPSRKYYIMISASCAVFLAVTAVVSAVAFAAPKYSVRLNDSGRVFRADTAEDTVGEFLTSNGVTVSESDVVEVSLAAPIEDDMEIVIRRAVPVTINVDGAESTVDMLAGTVSEALSKAGIELDENDEVYPAGDTYVTGDMSVDIVRVDYEYVTEKETLYYKEISKNDSKLEKGVTKLQQGGENGYQENEIKITYKNGVEIARETVKTTVVKEPVDEITIVGTYVAPTPTPAPSATTKPDSSKEPSSTKKPSSTSTKKPSSTATKKPSSSSKWATNADGLLIKLPTVSMIHSFSTLSDHKSAPAPDESIIAKTVVLDDCTAYSDSQTATGVKGQLGTIAADPKRFPYGTKVYVPGYGYGRIEDTGSMRHREETLWDLWMPSESACERWGRKHNLKVYILKD